MLRRSRRRTCTRSARRLQEARQLHIQQLQPRVCCGERGRGTCQDTAGAEWAQCNRTVPIASWHITSRSVLPSRERGSRKGGTHRRPRPRRSPRRRRRCPLTAACWRTSPSPADSTSIRSGPMAQCSLTSQWIGNSLYTSYSPQSSCTTQLLWPLCPDDRCASCRNTWFAFAQQPSVSRWLNLQTCG